MPFLTEQKHGRSAQSIFMAQECKPYRRRDGTAPKRKKVDVEVNDLIEANADNVEV